MLAEVLCMERSVSRLHPNPNISSIIYPYPAVFYFLGTRRYFVIHPRITGSMGPRHAPPWRSELRAPSHYCTFTHYRTICTHL
jgi:hypothetical protein